MWNITSENFTFLLYHRASLVPQMVKNLRAIQETQVQSLGREDSLEKGMAIHSSILAWRIPWTEEPGGLQSMGSQKSPYVTIPTYSSYISNGISPVGSWLPYWAMQVLVLWDTIVSQKVFKPMWTIKMYLFSKAHGREWVEEEKKIRYDRNQPKVNYHTSYKFTELKAWDSAWPPATRASSTQRP